MDGGLVGGQRARACSNIASQQGFTLIELTLVILIIALLSIAAVPKWTAVTSNLNYEARRFLNDIRYVQALSLTTGQRYRFVKISSSTYQIQNESGTPITLPTGSTTLTLTSGVTMGTFTNLPNSLVAFNSQGIPYTDTLIPGTALASTASLPLSGGGQTVTIQISPATGYGVLQ